MSISIIIPVKNEEQHLINLFQVIDSYPSDYIYYFCDGGCTDNSLNLIKNYKNNSDKIIHIFSEKSNFGSILSTFMTPINEITSDYILLHPVDIDCSNYIAQLDDFCKEDYYVFMKEYFPKNIILIFQTYILNNFRLKKYNFVWTNGVLLKTRIFKHCQHLTSNFLEDIILSDYLKKNFKGCLLPLYTICSSRRYLKEGTLKRVLLNSIIMFCYRVLRIDTKVLKKIYYKI